MDTFEWLHGAIDNFIEKHPIDKNLVLKKINLLIKIEQEKNKELLDIIRKTEGELTKTRIEIQKKESNIQKEISNIING